MTIQRKNIKTFFKCAAPLCAVVFINGTTVLFAYADGFSPQGAANEVVKARIIARDLNAAKAKQLQDVANELYVEKYLFESRAILQILVKSKFVAPRHYVLMALTYNSVLGDDDKAKPTLQCLDKALQLDPDCSYAYAIKAKFANQEGRYDDAVKLTDRALKCKAIDYGLYEFRGTALANLNRNEEALKAMEMSTKYFPYVPEPFRIKGSILENLGRYSQAVDAYRTAWKLNQTDWNVFRIAHCLEMQNKTAEAISELSQQIKRNPKDGEAFRTRALLKVKTKDLPGAIKDYDACIELEPTARTYKDRAKLHLQMGHKDLANRDLAQAAKIENSPF